MLSFWDSHLHLEYIANDSHFGLSSLFHTYQSFQISIYSTAMSLSLTKVAETYFDKLFKAPNTSSEGRVLLLDPITTPSISLSYTQTDLLKNDVILVELITKPQQLDFMKNLSCVVYISPSLISYLIDELANPHFGSYKVYFNNSITKNQLEKLAESDQYELIASVIELFNDYLIINDNLFLTKNHDDNENSHSSDVTQESKKLMSLLLSLKQLPIIKFESNSINCRKLASELLYSINLNSNNNLFDSFDQDDSHKPILLILDRSNDPITPILNPWTYQSMIHEFIGIEKNIINVKNENYTLNDPFFLKSSYLNYGDLTENFSKTVEEYKQLTKTNINANLADLKKQLSKFPEYKKLTSNILKHLSIIEEIDLNISEENLWEIGELQQLIINGLENYNSLRSKLLVIISNTETLTIHKVKLIILFQYRFPENDLSILIQNLNDHSTPTVSQNDLIKKFQSLFPSVKYKSNVPTNSSNLANIFNKKISFNNLFNNEQQGAQNDNIYMQYTPTLNETLKNLMINESKNLSTMTPDNIKKKATDNVKNVIIYFKGGVTYEEARLVHELDVSNKSLNLLIGGFKLINSHTWFDSMYDMINEAPVNTSTRDRKLELRDLL